MPDLDLSHLGGWIDSPKDVESTMDNLPFPIFSDVWTPIKGTGIGKIVVLTDIVEKVTGSFKSRLQEVGDCVSMAKGLAVDIAKSVDIWVNKDFEEWIAETSTEDIYGGARVIIGKNQIRGDGCVGAWAAKWLTDYGALPRGKYGDIDTTKYSGSRARTWGSSGVPQSLIVEIKKHPIQITSQVKSYEQARDLIANGYPIAVCSNLGFSNQRDKNGVSKPSGSWAHCMCVIGVWDDGNIRRLLIQNSWGCYSDDTEVLTKDGWKFFKDLTYSDILATLNPENHNLEWQQIQNKFEYDYNGYLNHYHYRGVDLLVTDNHNMYVGNPNKDLSDIQSWNIVESKDCNKSIAIKKDCNWIGKEVKTYNIGDIEIDMDLWLEFLGYFLSEGSTSVHNKVLSNGESKKYGSCAISQIKVLSKNKMIECLNKMPFKFTKNMVCTNKDLYKELSIFGKSYNKHIPTYVKDLSSRQQKILFDALMLGDGSYSDGKVNYYTSSKLLADDFQELTLKIGICSDVIEIDRVGRDNGSGGITRHKEYRLNIKTVSKTPNAYGTIPLSLPYNGKIYCATVPNHIMYVRRNGRACWCGNSWNGGPKTHNQPDGSFWVEADIVEKYMFSQNDSWAFSGYTGFEPKELNTRII